MKPNFTPEFTKDGLYIAHRIAEGADYAEAHGVKYTTCVPRCSLHRGAPDMYEALEDYDKLLNHGINCGFCKKSKLNPLQCPQYLVLFLAVESKRFVALKKASGEK